MNTYNMYANFLGGPVPYSDEQMRVKIVDNVFGEGNYSVIKPSDNYKVYKQVVSNIETGDLLYLSDSSQGSAVLSKCKKYIKARVIVDGHYIDGIVYVKETVLEKLILEIEKLMTLYRELRDTDEILRSEYFDPISYDIQGYEEAIFDAEYDEDIECLKDIKLSLKNQIKAFTKMVTAIKKVKFIYG